MFKKKAKTKEVRLHLENIEEKLRFAMKDSLQEAKKHVSDREKLDPIFSEYMLLSDLYLEVRKALDAI